MSSNRPELRIVMIGQRGVPATFGGIEHHVEELGAELAALGHDVTIYARTNYVRDRVRSHRGVTVRRLPTVGTKHFDTIVHSLLSTADALRNRPDVVHFHGLGPGLMAPLVRALRPGCPVVLTVHGSDDERAKWGAVARNVLRLGRWMSERVPHLTITVSQELTDRYRAAGANVRHIPNGVRLPASHSNGGAARFGLRPRDYVLFVGRLVPEKGPHTLVRAFQRLDVDRQLALVGGSSFTDGYVHELRDLAAGDDRIVFCDYVYGDILDDLYDSAAAFVLPSTLEGMPLTLLEAAAHGLPIVASDIGVHQEVLGRDGPGRRMFPAGDENGLAEALRKVLDGGVREWWAAQSIRRSVLTSYSWSVAALEVESAYLDLFDSGRHENTSRPVEVRGDATARPIGVPPSHPRPTGVGGSSPRSVEVS